MAILNERALIDWLEQRAVIEPVDEPPLLVRYAIYQGLADRIKSGQFNYIVNDDHDLSMEEGNENG